MENVRKYRHQTFNNRKKKKVFRVRPNYQGAKFFTEIFLAIEMSKTQVLKNKLDYLVLSILELSKILIYDF